MASRPSRLASSTLETVSRSMRGRRPWPDPASRAAPADRLQRRSGRSTVPAAFANAAAPRPRPGADRRWRCRRSPPRGRAAGAEGIGERRAADFPADFGAGQRFQLRSQEVGHLPAGGAGGRHAGDDASGVLLGELAADGAIVFRQPAHLGQGRRQASAARGSLASSPAAGRSGLDAFHRPGGGFHPLRRRPTMRTENCRGSDGASSSVPRSASNRTAPLHSASAASTTAAGRRSKRATKASSHARARRRRLPRRCRRAAHWAGTSAPGPGSAAPPPAARRAGTPPR